MRSEWEHLCANRERGVIHHIHTYVIEAEEDDDDELIESHYD